MRNYSRKIELVVVAVEVILIDIIVVEVGSVLVDSVVVGNKTLIAVDWNSAVGVVPLEEVDTVVAFAVGTNYSAVAEVVGYRTKC